MYRNFENLLQLNPLSINKLCVQLCYGIKKAVLKSNDSKFYNINRNTFKLGNSLELHCSPINSYFST